MKVVDLFCGAGGLALGFEAAGFEIAAAVDSDPVCAATFEQNFARLQPRSRALVLGGPEKGDAARLDLDSLGRQVEPDVLIGGPPCQGFSRVGRAKLNSLLEDGFESDPRNELYRRFLEAAAVWHPRAVVMENVPGMLSVKGRNVAEAAAADLAALGYEVGYAVLNAVWYGVPQFRERFFMIGIRSDLGVRPKMPRATHAAALPSGYRRPNRPGTLPLPFLRYYELPVEPVEHPEEAVSVEAAIGDLPPIARHLVLGDEPLSSGFRQPVRLERKPMSPYAGLMRDWTGLGSVESVDDHAIRLTPRDYETFRRMRPGDRYPDAWDIMQERLREELLRIERSTGSAPERGTLSYQRLEKSIVAPYPKDIFPDKWRKLIPDAPSWTLPAHLAKDSYSHIHHDDDQARTISVREAARLQSFPDAFSFAGNMGDCFRQIGNAVPPLMGRAIGRQVRLLLGSRPA